MSRREHGGNLDAAMARFGGRRADWLDLSTGINPVPWPVRELPVSEMPMNEIPVAVWARLPEESAFQAVKSAARAAYDVADANAVAVAAGAQALIRILPQILGAGQVGVLGPTYGEYQAVFPEALECRELSALAGRDVAIIVNPNNPDGRRLAPAELCALAASVGVLVVDESFADTAPELSLCDRALPPNLLALRSFGKFFGLAGLRLGFAIGAAEMIARLEERLGPWAVSGLALAVGARALGDRDWISATRTRLCADMARLQDLLAAAGFRPVGATGLFATVADERAGAWFEHLAAAHIWVRRFDHAPERLRFGLPGDAAGWARLRHALAAG